MQAHAILFGLLWIGACGYALVRGGAPERIVALCFLAGALLSPLAQLIGRTAATAFSHLEVGVLLIDTTILGLILWVALFSARYWVMAMASMQAAIPIAHIANVIAPAAVPRVYFAMAVTLAFPQLVLLAVATWRHQARLTRYGIDYAWAGDLPERYRAGAPVDAAMLGRDDAPHAGAAGDIRD